MAEPANRCVLTETDKGRQYWLSRPYVDDDVRAALATASAILIPEEGFRDVMDPLFYQGSIELMRFLRSQGVATDICIANDDYREISLNFDLISVGAIFLTAGVMPLVVNLLTEYIKKRTEGRRSGAGHIDVRLLVEASDAERDRVFEFSYRGPVEDLASTVDQAGLTGLLNSDRDLRPPEP